MNRRVEFFQASPELTKKLQELGQLTQHGSLGNTIIDLVNISSVPVEWLRVLSRYA